VSISYNGQRTGVSRAYGRRSNIRSASSSASSASPRCATGDWQKTITASVPASRSETYICTAIACSDSCRPAPETSRLTLQFDPQRSITLSIDASPAQPFTPQINCIPVQKFLRRPFLLLAGTHKSLTYTTMRAIGGAVIVLLTLPLQRRRLPNLI
jgi:hypothetical protein